MSDHSIPQAIQSCANFAGDIGDGFQLGVNMSDGADVEVLMMGSVYFRVWGMITIMLLLLLIMRLIYDPD